MAAVLVTYAFTLTYKLSERKRGAIMLIWYASSKECGLSSATYQTDGTWEKGDGFKITESKSGDTITCTVKFTFDQNSTVRATFLPPPI